MSPPASRRWPTTIALVLLLALTVAARREALEGPFWSEDYFNVEYVHRRGAIPVIAESLRGRVFGVFDFYRPVAVALIALEGALLPPKPEAYRAVTLALTWLTGVLVFLAVRRTIPERLGLPFAAAALFVVARVQNEPFHLTVAGQVDTIATLFVALTLWGFLRGAAWSGPTAVFAYAAKESAFGLGGALMLLAFSLPGSPTRALRRLGCAHAALSVVAFVARGRILGALKTPYGSADSWLERILDGIRELPRAALAACGPSLAITVGIGGLLFVLGGRTERASVRGLRCAALFAVVALMAPLSALPLAGVDQTFGTRNFLPAVLLAIVVAAWGLSRAPRLGAVAMALAAVCAHRDAESAAGPLRAATAGARELLSEIAALPGEGPVFVAGLPPALQWAYPAAGRPPFRSAPRTIYPLRLGTDGHTTLLPLRPTPDDVIVARVVERSLLVERPFGTGAAASPTVRRDSGRFQVDGLDPIAALADLAVSANPGTAPWVLVRMEDGDRRFERRIDAFPSGALPQRVVLSDVPLLPGRRATLTVRNATDVRWIPPIGATLTIQSPAAGQIIDLEAAVRPFQIEGLPPEAKALRVTLFTAGGAIMIVVPARAFSLATLHDLWPKEPLSLLDVVHSALKLGDPTFFVTVEALLEVSEPGATLARSPLHRLRFGDL